MFKQKLSSPFRRSSGIFAASDYQFFSKYIEYTNEIIYVKRKNLESDPFWRDLCRAKSRINILLTTGDCLPQVSPLPAQSSPPCQPVSTSCQPASSRKLPLRGFISELQPVPSPCPDSSQTLVLVS